MNRFPSSSILLHAAMVLTIAVAGRAEAPPTRSLNTHGKASALSQDERALQVLNRFTFGPTPSELQSVKEMGADKWLERQLHPEKIDDGALALRLNALPAMHLSSAELLRRFPARPLLREVEAGKLSIPADPVERSIYLNALERVRGEREKKRAGQQQPEAGIGRGAETGSPMGASAQSTNQAGGADAGPAAEERSRNAEAGDVNAKEERQQMIGMPVGERWKALLAEQPGELRPLVQGMKPQEREALVKGFTPEQKEALTAMVDINRVVAGELMEEKVLRAIYSDRQLNEVMTDFWLNHFNVYLRKNGEMPWLLATYERDVIRPRALGRFEDLLGAVAHSPAMMVYLDNQQSIGPDSLAASRGAVRKGKGSAPGLNENYARELMELHTLGVDGGYTQKDVAEVAKVFTGWGVAPQDGYAFRFESRRHEPGSKAVMGRKVNEGGEAEGQEVLHVLAESPATAKFISTKLAMRFVSDAPPPALIDKMAKRYVKSHGDIRDVLREMVKSPEFWSADEYRNKMKTPLEFVASAARATNANVENAASLVQALDRLGMPLYGVQQPNGYSLKADPWLASEGLLMRFNFALAFSANRLPGVEVTLPYSAGSESELESMLEQNLVGEAVSPQTRATVLAQMDKMALPSDSSAIGGKRERGQKGQPRGDLFVPAAHGKQPEEQDRSVVIAALLLGSPDFQRR